MHTRCRAIISQCQEEAMAMADCDEFLNRKPRLPKKFIFLMNHKEKRSHYHYQSMKWIARDEITVISKFDLLL